MSNKTLLYYLTSIKKDIFLLLFFVDKNQQVDKVVERLSSLAWMVLASNEPYSLLRHEFIPFGSYRKQKTL